MSDPLRIFLLGYSDNPVGAVFLNTFMKNGIRLSGLVVEDKRSGKNWTRLRKKIRKDGFPTAMRRLFHVVFLKLFRRTPVHLAEKMGIPVYHFQKFNSQECMDLLAKQDIDLLTIASAPILKEGVFTTARLGCLNAHPGWLPAYRGIGANAHAMKNGDSPGVSIHFIDAGIDTGRIICREKIPVRRGDTVAKINDRSVARGAELMCGVIESIRKNALKMPQIDEKVGEMYRAMPYRDVKIVNKRLKKTGGIHGV
jgi:folate-dependent phosphoribosylglycinamide formyltransferase PurN